MTGALDLLEECAAFQCSSTSSNVLSKRKKVSLPWLTAVPLRTEQKARISKSHNVSGSHTNPRQLAVAAWCWRLSTEEPALDRSPLPCIGTLLSKIERFHDVENEKISCLRRFVQAVIDPRMNEHRCIFSVLLLSTQRFVPRALIPTLCCAAVAAEW
jgi:hypothetical protein